MGNHRNIRKKSKSTVQGLSDPETDTQSLHSPYLSYIDPSMPRIPFRVGLRHYAASAFIYGSILLIFSVCPWFRDVLSTKINGHSVYSYYWLAYLLYLMISPFIIFIGRPRSLWASKNLMIAGYLKRLILSCFTRTKPDLTQVHFGVESACGNICFKTE